MNQLQQKIQGFEEAKAREMIAKHPECRRQAICSFILSNVLIAHDLERMLRTIEVNSLMSPLVDEFFEYTTNLILDDFRKTFGHDMIAPVEPEHDRQ